MDELKLHAAFEYQRFSPNAKLGVLIDRVYDRYLSQGLVIPDDELDISAAGEIEPFSSRNGLNSFFAEGKGLIDK